jgi:hypothetical protein
LLSTFAIDPVQHHRVIGLVVTRSFSHPEGVRLSAITSVYSDNNDSTADGLDKDITVKGWWLQVALTHHYRRTSSHTSLATRVQAPLPVEPGPGQALFCRLPITCIAYPCSQCRPRALSSYNHGNFSDPDDQAGVKMKCGRV